MESYSGTVEERSGGIRLDRYAAETLGITSRSQIKSRILEARLNGKPVKLSRPVKAGDRVELSWLPAAPVHLEPEDIPLKILYEDQRCVVINKSQGMVVHPGAGNHAGTLANALLWRRYLHLYGPPDRWPKEPENHPDLRTGIVHRLDKDTSGAIIAAYDDEALAFLSAQFKARTVRKRYLALVQGTPREPEGRIQTALIRDPKNRKRFAAAEHGGKIALTRYRLVRSWGEYSLLLLKPQTGRTHQLRVHLSCLGHPILGDPIYNPAYEPDRAVRGRISVPSLLLHAYSLELTLPGTNELRRFTAPLPRRFKTTMAALDNG